VSALAFVFSSGWASGLNCYLVVLVLGVSDRVHDTAQVPNVLQRWDVLGVVWFAIQHPEIAAAIAAVLLVGGLILLYVLAQAVRRGWRRWKGRDRVPDPA
jgi:threonine/homoserine/homoserine lactone efflux protein